MIYQPKGGESTVEPGETEAGDEIGSNNEQDPDDDYPREQGGLDGGDGTGEPTKKYIVKGVPVNVISERVQYIGTDGKLITESLKDYTSKTVKQEYATLNDFLRKWNDAEQKQAVIQELEEQGVIWQALQDEVGKDYGAFDLICHIVYGQPPLTRKERADQVRKRDVFTQYGEQAQKVLEALLEKYADEGITPIENIAVLRVQPFNEMGRPKELINGFGGKAQYQQAVKDLEKVLYA